MKKILLLSIAMLISVASFAQKKGDMYVSGYFATDLGGYSVESHDWLPFESVFDVGAEYGYFVADNLRIGLEASFPFSTALEQDMDGESYRYNSVEFDVFPNIAYYVKMAENCYYTPEFGLGYILYNSKTTGSELYASTSHSSTWGAYLNILSFEFKVNEKFSIGVSGGGIGLYTSKHVYAETEAFNMNQFVCDLDSGVVEFKFYF